MMLDLDVPSTSYIQFPPAFVREAGQTGAGPIGPGAIIFVPGNIVQSAITRLHVPSPTPRTGEHGISKELAFRAPNAERLECLRELEQYGAADWDNEGAAPVSQDAMTVAAFVFSLLPASAPNPDVAVGADGSLCLEWYRATQAGDCKLFVDIGPTPRALVYMREGGAPPFEVHPLWNSVEFLASLVEVFTSFFSTAPYQVAA
jgi:hypothetical protein